MLTLLCLALFCCCTDREGGGGGGEFHPNSIAHIESGIKRFSFDFDHFDNNISSDMNSRNPFYPILIPITSNVHTDFLRKGQKGGFGLFD